MSWAARHRRLSRGEEVGPDHLWSALLRPLSWLYRGYAAARNAAYDARLLPRTAVDRPVISIGSLAAGGTGKTPLMALLGNRLQAGGRRPLLVVRGYRAPAATAAVRVVHLPGEEAGVSYGSVGDEAVLLARMAPNCAVATARRREEAVQAVRARGSDVDVVLLDGAFQHRRLIRDLDVVTLDGSRAPGFARLLPWGDFRETWAALRRAGLIVLMRADACADRRAWEEYLARRAPGVRVAWCHSVLGMPYRLGSRPSGLPAGEVAPTETETAQRWASLRSRRIGLYAGIGAPEAFRAALASRGISPVWIRVVRDHARFDEREARRVADGMKRAGVDALLITEKDAIRMERLADRLPAGVVVPAELVIAGGAEAWVETIAARIPLRGAAADSECPVNGPGRRIAPGGA